MDIAEYKGSNYLIAVDYYSRWLEIIEIKYKDSSTIISKLKPLFSKFEITMEIIGDNMPFGSREFLEFANDWEFEVNTASPHYPQSNGLAEKGVGIAKKLIQKCKEEGHDIDLYLLNYRNTQVANLDYSPAQLLMNRKLRSKLPTTIDNVTAKVNINAYEQMLKIKQKQKNYFDKNSSKTATQFNSSDKIYVQNYKNKFWEKGVVREKCKSPRSFLIQLENGTILRRNVINIRKRKGLEFSGEQSKN